MLQNRNLWLAWVLTEMLKTPLAWVLIWLLSLIICDKRCAFLVGVLQRVWLDKCLNSLLLAWYLQALEHKRTTHVCTFAHHHHARAFAFWLLCVLIHSLFVLSCRSTLIQVAALEACEKEKKKAEEQIEELMKKLAKFEEDMAVGAQVCNTHSLL